MTPILVALVIVTQQGLVSVSPHLSKKTCAEAAHVAATGHSVEEDDARWKADSDAYHAAQTRFLASLAPAKRKECEAADKRGDIIGACLAPYDAATSIFSLTGREFSLADPRYMKCVPETGDPKWPPPNPCRAWNWTRSKIAGKPARGRDQYSIANWAERCVPELIAMIAKAQLEWAERVPLTPQMARAHVALYEDALDRATKAEAELADQYIDDAGTVWVRPTAWAYFAACRALHAKEAEALAVGERVGVLEAAARRAIKPLEDYAGRVVTEARHANRTMLAKRSGNFETQQAREVFAAAKAIGDKIAEIAADIRSALQANPAKEP